MSRFFDSVESVARELFRHDYIASRRIATVVFLAGRLGKPLLVEGPAGVGKTDLARAVAEAMNTELIRLQCYPGLDEAKTLYEWNYQKQLLYIQSCHTGKDEWEKIKEDIFSLEFLIARPLLKAFMSPKPVVLLIDEIDKSDEELESFLMEALSEFQVTIPEFGPVRALSTPFVILTSNNSRMLSDALKRRCLHLFIPYPDLEHELAIVQIKVPGIEETLARQIVKLVQALRKNQLKKAPSIAETIDWARTVMVMGKSLLDREFVDETLNVLLKYEEDVALAREKIPAIWPQVEQDRRDTPSPSAGSDAPVKEVPRQESRREPVDGRDWSRFDF